MFSLKYGAPIIIRTNLDVLVYAKKPTSFCLACLGSLNRMVRASCVCMYIYLALSTRAGNSKHAINRIMFLIMFGVKGPPPPHIARVDTFGQTGSTIQRTREALQQALPVTSKAGKKIDKVELTGQK
jgi:hypothetical protein